MTLRKKVLLFVVGIVVILGAFMNSVQDNHGIPSYTKEYSKLPGYKNDKFQKAKFNEKFYAVGAKVPASVEINQSASNGNMVARVTFVNAYNKSVLVAYSQADAKSHQRALVSVYNSLGHEDMTDMITVKGVNGVTYGYYGFHELNKPVVDICRTEKNKTVCAKLDVKGVKLFYTHLSNFIVGNV